MELQGKEKMVWEAVREDYEDVAQFLQFAEEDEMYVKVSCAVYEELEAIADGHEFDEDFEIEVLKIGRFSIGYDPYEDWDAEEL